ncbi:L-threonylcarbamoyladenylate synthase [Heyndrickxia vini]|uniref:Threonylcarbamoyl-AMP synthase n=1 Tax=Heyndrickxia vini TaxID=1476025 RepID=A0ABX7E329_9BACI|nr:L-threonylcarbamoyladenylate synthase [Heyndrickxia vini]QQZ09222.1 threonylcarbamoyl-AMP synthase [Heyndrickxia vini]
MKTIQWSVDKHVDNFLGNPQLEEASELLRQNEVVAFPTETVYGLGANAKSDLAVMKIYEAKGRPSDNPLIVHIAEKNQLEELVTNISEQAQILMQRFWPGPLTIIFNCRPGILSEKVTAGMDTVGIRMPDHPLAHELIRLTNLPIAAPSANRSGKPSPTTAWHVLDDLNGRIAGIVDGGYTGVGVESTVIDCTGDIPMILRPGGVSKEQIEMAIGEVLVDPALNSDTNDCPKSPGMKYTHYAPDAPVYLVEGTFTYIQELVNKKQKEGLKVGVIATEETKNNYRADCVIACGSRNDLSTVAHNLYDTLRAFNNQDVDLIFSETFSVEGIGLAIMNRLEKAAGHRWVRQ